MNVVSRQGDIVGSLRTGLLIVADVSRHIRIETRPIRGSDVWHVGFKIDTHQTSKTALALHELFKVVLGYGLLHNDATIVFPSPRKTDLETRPRIVMQRRKGEWVTLETTSPQGRSPVEVILPKEELPPQVLLVFQELFIAMRSDQSC